VSIEDVTVSLEVTSRCDVDDNAEYSFEFVVASGVFSMFVAVVGDISVFVSSGNSLVDSSDLIDESKSASEFGVVVNNAFSDKVKLVFNILTDTVDASLVCCGE
jgi:hypothetical protein